ncbi:hypothetical protein SETIT_8G057600v2 [Setaria italica]|uniref:Uncharacterized protein n=1 Tax=Setaria italica TaxID=4555 RepID=A0A368S4W3_SETIT|nr:hypothetical protein SETIT_8G057600v2 [Setaria italica]
METPAGLAAAPRAAPAGHPQGTILGHNMSGERKLGASSLHILPSSSRVVQITGDEKSSTTNGLLHVLRELAPWRHEHIGSGSSIQDYPHIYSGEKRPFSALGNDSYCTSRNPRAQHESSTYAMSTSSYGGSPHAITGYFPPYHHDTRRCLPDSDYGLTEPWGGIQLNKGKIYMSKNMKTCC